MWIQTTCEARQGKATQRNPREEGHVGRGRAVCTMFVRLSIEGCPCSLVSKRSHQLGGGQQAVSVVATHTVGSLWFTRLVVCLKAVLLPVMLGISTSVISCSSFSLATHFMGTPLPRLIIGEGTGHGSGTSHCLHAMSGPVYIRLQPHTATLTIPVQHHCFIHKRFEVACWYIGIPVSYSSTVSHTSSLHAYVTRHNIMHSISLVSKLSLYLPLLVRHLFTLASTCEAHTINTHTCMLGIWVEPSDAVAGIDNHQFQGTQPAVIGKHLPVGQTQIERGHKHHH